jgi:hypothetical protein
MDHDQCSLMLDLGGRNCDRRLDLLRIDLLPHIVTLLVFRQQRLLFRSLGKRPQWYTDCHTYGEFINFASMNNASSGDKPSERQREKLLLDSDNPIHDLDPVNESHILPEIAESSLRRLFRADIF